MTALEIANPPWIAGFVDWDRRYGTDEEKMRLAVALSQENVFHATGGPFGAAVFERPSGRLVSVGVNSVVRLNNCTLHAEMMAFMMAQARVQSFTLDGVSGVEHEMVTSCEPCAMCLGAALWAGVHRVVTGATGEDARAIGFDEGPVFPQSYAYLQERHVDITRGVLRDEARAVLRSYGMGQGQIYNGKDIIAAPVHADTLGGIQLPQNQRTFPMSALREPSTREHVL